MKKQVEFSFGDDSVAKAYDTVLVPSLCEPWASQLMNDKKPWAENNVLDLACGTSIYFSFRKPKRIHAILFFWIMFTWGFLGYGQINNEEASREIIQMYCGACHVAPDPSDLPKDLWGKTVLNEMGSYYGIKKEGFGLLKKMKAEELDAIKSLNIYPEIQLIPNETWQTIENYFINNAPEEITKANDRKNRTKNLKAFKRKDIDLLGLPGSLITALVYDDSKNELWIGEDRAMAYTWSLKNGVSNNASTGSAVSHIVVKSDSIYLLEIGSLRPTELENGSLSMVYNNEKKTLIEKLHRPVYLNVDDLNADGTSEIVVCNFGNKTGSLCLFEQVNGKFQKTIIHQQAGAIKCLVHDMNDDGLKDLVAMFSQGDESIYIFFQKEDLKFEMKKVLRFNPLFGSNDFVLVDYEGDGDMDIVVAQGDNADLTVRSKPYHGIRLFINTDNIFEERFFYPIYGATKVLAHDFDQDGDVDLVATAFFQDYENLPNEGLIYLENLESENFKFQSFSLKNSDPIKSYTLAKGDIDQDGDVDIIFGLFSWPITRVPQSMKTLWQGALYDMTVLFNKLE